MDKLTDITVELFQVPFAHAVANFAALEADWPQLAKWCYVTRKLSAKTIHSSLLKIDNILADIKTIILPDFWSQPNSPNLSAQTLYVGVKSVHLCLNSARAQIINHIKRSYTSEVTSKSPLLMKRDENIQVWLDTMNLTLERETFMSSKVAICSLFVDRLKAQCAQLLTFSSVPGFINVKAQIPANIDENAQIILVGDVARFIGAIEPDFIEVANQFRSGSSILPFLNNSF